MLSNAEQQEILRRRTFAIISHPDAGKTTLTEKLLLYGGAIHVAGAVKSNKIRKTATSDWMEIEKQRGISVATSVMGFDYNNYHINILDTPGHQDFAEDTFRTLTAVDSVVIVIDSAKGVETQTRRLMQVCRMRKTPVMVFINKMDREGKDPFDLMDEVESELGIHVRPLSWPINSGERFKGVYNIFQSTLDLYTPNKTQVTESLRFEDVHDPQIAALVGEQDALKLQEDLEMIEGVYNPFSREDYLAGDLAPVLSSVLSVVCSPSVTFSLSVSAEDSESVPATVEDSPSVVCFPSVSVTLPASEPATVVSSLPPEGVQAVSVPRSMSAASRSETASLVFFMSFSFH